MQALFYAFNESGTGLLGQRDLLRMLEAMLPSFSAMKGNQDNSHLRRILDQVMGINQGKETPPTPAPVEKALVVERKKDIWEQFENAVNKGRRRFDKLIGFYRIQMDAFVMTQRRRAIKAFAKTIARYYRVEKQRVASRLVSQWRYRAGKASVPPPMDTSEDPTWLQRVQNNMVRRGKRAALRKWLDECARKRRCQRILHTLLASERRLSLERGLSGFRQNDKTQLKFKVKPNSNSSSKLNLSLTRI